MYDEKLKGYEGYEEFEDICDVKFKLRYTRELLCSALYTIRVDKAPIWYILLLINITRNFICILNVNRNLLSGKKGGFTNYEDNQT